MQSAVAVCQVGLDHELGLDPARLNAGHLEAWVGVGAWI